MEHEPLNVHCTCSDCLAAEEEAEKAMDEQEEETDELCYECDGTGFWYGEGISGECPECGGTGRQ